MARFLPRFLPIKILAKILTKIPAKILAKILTKIMRAPINAKPAGGGVGCRAWGGDLTFFKNWQ